MSGCSYTAQGDFSCQGVAYGSPATSRPGEAGIEAFGFADTQQKLDNILKQAQDKADEAAKWSANMDKYLAEVEAFNRTATTDLAAKQASVNAAASREQAESANADAAIKKYINLSDPKYKVTM